MKKVSDLVSIKEYVGGFDGCHLTTVGEKTDIKVVRNCLQAMFDYIQALEEKRLDDPLGFENCMINNSKP